jgi:hypothetical protein
MDLRSLFVDAKPIKDSASLEENKENALDTHFSSVSKRIQDDKQVKKTPQTRQKDDERIPVTQLQTSKLATPNKKEEAEEYSVPVPSELPPVFEQEDTYTVVIQTIDGELEEYEVQTPLEEVFVEAWNLISPEGIAPAVEVWTDWSEILNNLKGNTVEAITLGDFVLYEYKPPVEVKVEKEFNKEVDTVIDHYTRAISHLRSSGRRTILDNLPAHLRRKTLKRIKDTKETSESDELASLISEYILTQDESTLKALLLKRADLDPSLQDALDFVLDFPNNELLAEEVAEGVEPLVEYFEINETDLPAFELMTSEEAEEEAEEEVIEKEEEEIKEKKEKEPTQEEGESIGDSALDDVVDDDENKDSDGDVDKNPETTSFPPADVTGDEPHEVPVPGRPDEDSEVAKVLAEAGIEFIDVNGYIIVKDDNPQTISERVQQILPEETDISLPIMSNADYHTIMDTKQRRHDILERVKDSKVLEGLPDVTKVVSEALRSGDLATADSRFYKRTLADRNWVTDSFKTAKALPSFIKLKDEIKDEFSLELFPAGSNEVKDAEEIVIGGIPYYVRVIK